MTKISEITSLSYEQKIRNRAAIHAGYFDNYDLSPRQWKHTFAGSFLWKNPSRTSTINLMRDMLGKVPEWEDITDENLKDFVDELAESGLAPSSIRVKCAELKAIINANRRKVPSEDFMRILTTKGNASQAVYLTREEMERFARFEPRTRVERFAHRNFMVEMLTGARRCDAEKLTIKNCNLDTGMISYVPKKTPGIIVSVPVDEHFNLRKYLAKEYVGEYTSDSFNDALRRMCCDCGLDTPCTITRRGETTTEPKWKFISSHTARRTFATNLYLAGIPLEDIAVMMGHGKNVETTKKYVCAERAVTPSVMAYFQS